MSFRVVFVVDGFVITAISISMVVVLVVVIKVVVLVSSLLLLFSFFCYCFYIITVTVAAVVSVIAVFRHIACMVLVRYCFRSHRKTESSREL